jgi:hypothetical protein
MVLDAPLINLILYCVQQLGVALGVGAQTVMLFAFVHATRDGIIDDTEAQFLRATRRVLIWALVFIVLSGVAITLMHATAGQGATILTAAFLFKWVLIATIIALSALVHVVPETFAEALLGANWYALFIVHILAPVSSWTNLLSLWGIWVVGFCLCWYAAVFMSRHAKGKIMEPKPLFTLFEKKAPATAAVKEEKSAEAEEVKVVPVPVEALPKEMPKIVLDPDPKAVPIAMPQNEPASTNVVIPVSSTFHPPVSSVQSPANITTDTPFLPQVPPLQPIPVVKLDSKPAEPQVVAAPAAASAATPSAGTLLQKPEELAAVAPEAAKVPPLGLNVMPKNPDQMPK